MQQAVKITKVGFQKYNLKTWSTLVAATGGLMAFHKCSWQVLSWRDVNGYMLPQSDENTNLHLQLTDHHGSTSTIHHKSNMDPNEGLGFSLCPTGSQRLEFNKRLNQVKECSNCI